MLIKGRSVSGPSTPEDNKNFSNNFQTIDWGKKLDKPVNFGDDYGRNRLFYGLSR